MSVDERILVGRWFLGAFQMSGAIRDYIVENKKIPDGLTDGIALVNDIKTQYEAHRVDVSAHSSADTTNVVSAADATNLASLITLANELKADYEAHRADGTAHTSPDTTNTVTLADATDIVSAVKLINAVKAAYEAHRISTASHSAADTTNMITKIDAFAWIQMWMGEPGGKYEITRETVDSKRQLHGVVKTQIKSQAMKVTLPVSTSKFAYLRDFAKLDPTAADTDDVVWLQENFGVELTGIPVLGYPVEADPNNESDIPYFTNSEETLLIFEGVNKGSVIKDFNGEQGLLGLELDALADTSGTAGKAKGKKGGIGTFAKVA